MSNANSVITAPVSIEDVKQVLGETSNDLGTLCVSKNINIFSIYKPVQQTSKFKSSAQQENRLNWEKGRNYNYGVVKPSKYAVAQLYASGTNNTIGKKIFNEDRVLGIERPNGAVYPYRLDDFDGYCHTCDWSNSGVGSYLYRYQFNGIYDGNVYVGDTLGFVLQFAASRGYVSGAERVLSFYDVFTDGTDYYPALLFECDPITQTEAGQVTSSGKIYKIISAPFRLKDISGNNVSIGTPYEIQTDSGVSLGTAVKGSTYSLALSIDLSSDVWSGYIGKTVRVLPCMVSARMYFRLQNEDSANTFFVFPNKIEDSDLIPFSVDMAEFTVGRAADNPYGGRYVPGISLKSYSNLSIDYTNHKATLGAATFSLTNTEAANAVTTFQVVSLECALYYMNSSNAPLGMASQRPTTLVSNSDGRRVLTSPVPNSITDFSYGKSVSTSDNEISASLYSGSTKPSGATKYGLGISVTIGDTIGSEATGKTVQRTFFIPILSI